jgi:hypothetical protein
MFVQTLSNKIISPGPSDFDLDLDAEKAGISFL